VTSLAAAAGDESRWSGMAAALSAGRRRRTEGKRVEKQEGRVQPVQEKSGSLYKRLSKLISKSNGV